MIIDDVSRKIVDEILTKHSTDEFNTSLSQLLNKNKIIINQRIEVIFNVGQILSKMNHYKISIKCFEYLLCKFPDENGSLKFSLLFEIGYQFQALGNFRNSVKYYEKALKLGKTDTERMLCYLNLGDAFTQIDFFSRSEYFLQKGLEIANETKNKKMISAFNGNFGNLFTKMGKFQQAREYYENVDDSLDLDEKNKYRKISAIANFFLGLGDYQNSIKYFLKSLKIAEATSDDLNIAISCGNLGLCYISIRDFSTAIDYLKRGLSISEKIEDTKGIAHCTTYLGKVYAFTHDFSNSIEYLLRSVKENKKNSLDSGLSNSYGLLATSYFLQLDSEHSKKYGNLSLEFSQKINFIEGQISAHNILGSSLYLEQDFKHAYEHFSK